VWSESGDRHVALLRKLGVQKTELIEYKSSGKVNGDKNRVVGYADVIVT